MSIFLVELNKAVGKSRGKSAMAAPAFLIKTGIGEENGEVHKKQEVKLEGRLDI
jgi:hypothetical protein